MTREDYILANSVVATIYNIDAAYSSGGPETELVNLEDFWETMTEAIGNKVSRHELENAIDFLQTIEGRL